MVLIRIGLTKTLTPEKPVVALSFDDGREVIQDLLIMV